MSGTKLRTVRNRGSYDGINGRGITWGANTLWEESSGSIRKGSWDVVGGVIKLGRAVKASTLEWGQEGSVDRLGKFREILMGRVRWHKGGGEVWIGRQNKGVRGGGVRGRRFINR